MSLSLGYFVVACAVVLTLFLVVYKGRGMRSALIAGGLVLLSTLALYAIVVTFITSRMD